MKEKGKFVEVLTVIKYKNEKDYKKKKHYERTVEEFDAGNCLLNAGMTLMWNLIIGESALHFDNSNAELGVGSDNTAANATQSDLLADGTWKAMEATYPQVSNQKVTFQSEFGSSDANFHWQECGARNETPTLMNRVVADKGTKSEGEVWTAKLEITLS